MTIKDIIGLSSAIHTQNQKVESLRRIIWAMPRADQHYVPKLEQAEAELSALCENMLDMTGMDEWPVEPAITGPEDNKAVRIFPSGEEGGGGRQIADDHIHRRPCKRDFEGKTIKRFEADADNIWRFWFADGTAFAIQSETFSGVACMELCAECVKCEVTSP